MSTSETSGVYCDASLGSFVEDLQFDTDAARAIMSHRGLSDSTIESISFHVGNLCPDAAPEKTILGTYNPETRVVNTFIGEWFSVVSGVMDQVLTRLVQERAQEKNVGIADLLDESLIEILDGQKREFIEHAVNEKANENLLHEIDHAVEFGPLSEAEILQKIVDYRHKLYASRQKRASGLILLGAAGLAIPMIEAYEKVSPHVVEESTIGGFAVTGLALFFARRLESRRPYDPLSYQEYTQSPWEIGANKFASEFAEQGSDIVENGQQLLTVKCKPQKFEFV
jgi:hypothetical protein